MKIIILTLFSVLSSLLYSQGNLQFNQVINLTNGSTYTVPAGKVLKIESVSMAGSSICLPRTSTTSQYCNGASGIMWYTIGIYAGFDYLTIGDYIFSVPQQTAACNAAITNPNCYSYTISEPPVKTPIWLPAGKTVSVNMNSIKTFISAIEFNIIP